MTIINKHDKDFYDTKYTFTSIYHDIYIVYAEHLQDAVDYLADYVENAELCGYIGSQEEYEECPDFYVIAGNHSIYLHTAILACVQEAITN